MTRSVTRSVECCDMMIDMSVSKGSRPSDQFAGRYRRRSVRSTARKAFASNERASGPAALNVTDDQPLTKERAIVIRFRGRSRSRRVKYGNQFGP